MDQLLKAMRTNPVGKTKDAHVHVYPTTNLVHTPPPHCDMVCLQDLAAGSPPDHSFFPLSWHLANSRWWDDLGIAPFHPTIQPKVHIPDITHPTFYSTTALQWFRGSSCPPPPLFPTNPPPPHRTPSRTPPWGDVQFPRRPQQGRPLAAPPQLC